MNQHIYTIKALNHNGKPKIVQHDTAGFWTVVSIEEDKPMLLLKDIPEADTRRIKRTSPVMEIDAEYSDGRIYVTTENTIYRLMRA